MGAPNEDLPVADVMTQLQDTYEDVEVFPRTSFPETMGAQERMKEVLDVFSQEVASGLMAVVNEPDGVHVKYAVPKGEKRDAAILRTRQLGGFVMAA